MTGFSRGTLSSSGNNGTGLDTVTAPNTIADSTQSFSLDAVGNQTSTATDGTTVNKTQNSKNELTGVGSSTLTYDSNGNTTTDENGNTLTYDAWNRMVTDSAGSTSYTFDANDRRITETHGSTTTDLYFSSQGQAIEERQGGTVTAQNVWSIDYINDLLLRDDNSTSGSLGISGSGLGNRVYYQHDANYNVTATIDNSGNFIQRYVYSPYGVQTVLTAAWATSSASNSIYGFQGGRYDIATGMNRFGARDYSSSTGTWAEPDPTIYSYGMNMYQSFCDSPVVATDATGLRAVFGQQAMAIGWLESVPKWSTMNIVTNPAPPASFGKNTVDGDVGSWEAKEEFRDVLSILPTIDVNDAGQITSAGADVTQTVGYTKLPGLTLVIGAQQGLGVTVPLKTTYSDDKHEATFTTIAKFRVGGLDNIGQASLHLFTNWRRVHRLAWMWQKIVLSLSCDGSEHVMFGASYIPSEAYYIGGNKVSSYSMATNRIGVGAAMDAPVNTYAPGTFNGGPKTTNPEQ